MSRKTKQEAIELARRRKLLQQRNVALKRQFIRQRTSAHSETNEIYNGLHHSFSKHSSFDTRDDQDIKHKDRVVPFANIAIETKLDETKERIDLKVESSDDPFRGSSCSKPRPSFVESSPTSKRNLLELNKDEQKMEEKIFKPPLPKGERPKMKALEAPKESENVQHRAEDDYLPGKKKKSKRKKTKIKEQEENISDNSLTNLLKDDLISFLNKPLSQDRNIVECYIERNKGGTSKRLFPEYQLFLKEKDTFLLAAKKRAKNRTSNYVISMDSTDLERKSSNCIGKLRANFLGTEFQIFDSGLNPSRQSKKLEKENISEQDSETDDIRTELGVVLYASNILGSRGPRRMRVAVPVVKKDGSRVICKSRDKKSAILQRFKKKQLGNLTELINKPPRWNDQVGAYVLNFNGRVTMASVKNFQLVLSDDEEHVVLQFGRVGKDLFTMDFAWPLSPLQAFAICLSSFDSKIACE